jgi:protein-tyrosine phosphatase
MLSLFKRKIESYGSIVPLTADMHSHLLPGIDDGVQTYDDSIAIIRQMIKLGYKKLIITPHIMADFFKNTPEIILDKLDKLKDIVQELRLDIELEAAAEYYLDEEFVKKVEKHEALLAFGHKKYILFETSYMNSSPYLNQIVFLLQSQGYQPVLAHPERYVYLFDNFSKLEELHRKGLLFQVNLNSLSGYYSKASKLLAEKLIDRKMVSFLGTDCHGEKHMKALNEARKTAYYQKAMQLDLLNHGL